MLLGMLVPNNLLEANREEYTNADILFVCKVQCWVMNVSGLRFYFGFWAAAIVPGNGWAGWYLRQGSMLILLIELKQAPLLIPTSWH